MGLFQEAVKGFVSGFVGGAVDNLRSSRSPNGVAAIERLLAQLGWSVDERVGDTGLILHFRDPLVNIRPVLVTCGENLAVISTFSSATLPGNRVPTEVLGYLLTRNTELTAGAWRASPSDGGNVSFAVAYCAFIEGLSAPIFKVICETQVKEVHAFDAKVKGAGLL